MKSGPGHEACARVKARLVRAQVVACERDVHLGQDPERRQAPQRRSHVRAQGVEDPLRTPPGHAVDSNHVHGQGDGERRGEHGAEQRPGNPEAGDDERDPEDEAQRHPDEDQRRQSLEPQLPLQDAVSHAERDGGDDVRSKDHRRRHPDVEEDAEERRATTSTTRPAAHAKGGRS